MCGICGFSGECDKRLLHSMLTSIKHRGPDMYGTYFNTSINLGHARLSIIDLSSNGKQPISNEEGDIVLTFNGEIYNYKELRRSLKQNHEFVSNTDAEVLVHLYEERGIAGIVDCNGMFAFSLYDESRNKLFLVRDRLGIKPLYYTLTETDDVVFASEIKALLKYPKIIKKVNYKALQSFLMHRANLHRETFFSGIYSLEPGQIFTFDLKQKTHSVSSFWDLPEKKDKISFQKAKRNVHNMLTSSVNYRLQSDVDVGLFLSSGIDSHAILSNLERCNSKKTHAFTLEFENYESSDSRFSRENDIYRSIDQHIVPFKEKNFSILSDVMYHLDEPQADPTCLANYWLSKKASEKVKVVLTGEGSDELFGGYPYYRFLRYKRLYQKLPSFVKKPVENNLEKIPLSVYTSFLKYAKDMDQSMYPRIRAFLEKPTYEAYKSLVQIYTPNEAQQIMKHGVSEEKFNNRERSFYLNELSRYELKNTLVNNLLMKVDKTSMAHSLEARVPFLDHRLVDYVYSLPSSYKTRLFKDKHILREAMKRHVPNKIRRNKKEYFFVPIHNLFQTGFKDYVQNFLDEKDTALFFKPHKVNSLIDGAKRGNLYQSRQLWSVVSFQSWYQRYFNEDK